jgi:hypothetical protein
MQLTHWDGSDVIVTDDRGHHVPVVEVCLEPGLAVVTVDTDARIWLTHLLMRANETLDGEVRSATTGSLHHCGALRVAVRA